MHGDQRVAARLEPQPLEDVRARRATAPKLRGHVHHHVADQVHAVADALGGQVVDRRLAGAEAQRARARR